MMIHRLIYPLLGMLGSLLPYEQYSRYVVTRFFAGDEPDWGFYLFPTDPPDIIKDWSNPADPDTRAYYHFSLHPVSTMLQARSDMQPYETFIPAVF